MRIEFAGRVTIHVYWFAYLKDAPQYGHDDNSTVADYFDMIISCSSDVPEEDKKYIKYQLQRHSKTCQHWNTHKCRFGFFMCHQCQRPSFWSQLNVEQEEEVMDLKQKWKKIPQALK